MKKLLVSCVALLLASSAFADLQEAGFHSFLCTDAISASQQGQIAPALRRMERAGAVSTGVLSVMYELIGDAAHPAFRSLLGLAKEIRQ